MQDVQKLNMNLNLNRTHADSVQNELTLAQLVGAMQAELEAAAAAGNAARGAADGTAEAGRSVMEMQADV